MDDDLAALARCVGDTDAFAGRHWGREPMLRRGAGPFDDLLDLDAVDALIASTARRPTFRLVRDGTPLPVGDYTTTVRMGGAAVDDVADVAKIGALLAAGATLVLQGLQRTWPPLVRFCRALERATLHPVQANAYLTPAGAAGLGRHADTHDVLVLQVSGAKGWDADGLGAFELAPGDVLYLPAGTRHSAAAQQDASLHLTVGLLRETYGTVVRRALADVDGIDDPLPIGHAGLAAELGRRLAAAADALAAVDAAALAEAETQRARRRRKPLLDRHLRSVLAAAHLDDATVVRRRSDNPAELRPDLDADGKLVLELVDRTVRIPAIARPAVEALLAPGAAGKGLAVGDLPGIDEGGRAVLARRLVREGLLEIDG